MYCTSVAAAFLGNVRRRNCCSEKGASITVEGFADSTPIKKSKFASNQALSEARANSVAAYLRGKGYSIAESVGFGSVSRNGKPPSRRVELVVAE